MGWYAIFVNSTKEEEVKEWINFYFKDEDIKVCVPKRKLYEIKLGLKKEVLKPLLIGYVLLKIDMDLIKYKKIIKLPYVINVLGNENYYTEIPNEEIDHIIELIDENDVIDNSEIVIKNNEIIALSGPLLGKVDRIVKLNKRAKRAKLEFNILGEIKHLDVSVDIKYM